METVAKKTLFVIVVFVGCYCLVSNGAAQDNLSRKELMSYYGGGWLCDIDCEDQTTGCYTREVCTVIAQESDECTFDLVVCTDATMDRACTEETIFGIECTVVTPPHSCEHKRRQNGGCRDVPGPGFACATYVAEVNPLCGTTATKCKN